MTTIEGLAASSPRQDQKLEGFAAQGFQSALIGMMGHDLRQSLQIIQGTYALLRSRPNASAPQAWVDRGEHALERLTGPLDCLVDAVYLAEHGNVLEITSVALAPLLWRLRNENESTAIPRGIDLRTQATPRYSVIRCCWSAFFETC